MKKLYLFIITILIFLGTNIVHANFQNQGFAKFEENAEGINFECNSQCFVILGELGSNDYLKINGSLNGSGSIGYGFPNGKQLVPGNGVAINGSNILNKEFSIKELNFYSQLPKNIQVILFIQGNIKGSSVKIELGELGLWEGITNGFNEALKYREYNPRTINFLEGPTWNGKYINEVFFWWIFFLVLTLFGIYFLIGKQSKIPIYLGIGVIVFFWVFFDFFSTVNEYRIYSDVTSATNIMQNGRVGKTSDFYQFLDFVRLNIPKGEKGTFIAPYPFDFEGKYHIYPDVKFDTIDKVKYIIWYNPYGSNNPFNFKDPVYSSGILTWDKYKLQVVKEIKFTDTAKIYIIK